MFVNCWKSSYDRVTKDPIVQFSIEGIIAYLIALVKKILYIPNLIPIDWGGVGIKETHCTEIDGRTNCSKIFNDWPTEFPLAAMEDCECKEESSLGCDSEDVEPQLDHCLPIADKCEIKRLCDRENLRNRICRQAENVFVTNMEPNGKSKSTISANY